MKAIVQDRFGGAEVLELRDVPDPVVGENDVLIQVRAAGCGPDVWHLMEGKPYLARLSPEVRKGMKTARGWDVAGRVDAVGASVTEFRAGDEVMGFSRGSFAEFAVASADKLARKPANVTFEQAAAVPVSGCTALQALRDYADVQPGQSVLVIGAGGGVGTLTVQIAKAFGADVTAVCSTSNVEQARSLGADRVVDYTQEDFTKLEERHDLMLDIAGSRSFLAFRRVLTPEATVVLVGGPMTYRGLGPLPHLGGTMLKSRGRSQTVKFFVAKINTADLVVMKELIEAGKVRSVIDRAYPLSEAVEALSYLGEGHARGKIVITA